MGYKFRNKNFFYTIHGFKNNYHHKVLNDVLDVDSPVTYCIKTGKDYLSFVRVL